MVTSEYAAPVLTRKYFQLNTLSPNTQIAQRLRDTTRERRRKSGNTDVKNPKPVYKSRRVRFKPWISEPHGAHCTNYGVNSQFGYVRRKTNGFPTVKQYQQKGDSVQERCRHQIVPLS